MCSFPVYYLRFVYTSVDQYKSAGSFHIIFMEISTEPLLQTEICRCFLNFLPKISREYSSGIRLLAGICVNKIHVLKLFVLPMEDQMLEVICAFKYTKRTKSDVITRRVSSIKKICLLFLKKIKLGHWQRYSTTVGYD